MVDSIIKLHLCFVVFMKRQPMESFSGNQTPVLGLPDLLSSTPRSSIIKILGVFLDRSSKCEKPTPSVVEPVFISYC